MYYFSQTSTRILYQVLNATIYDGDGQAGASPVEGDQKGDGNCILTGHVEVVQHAIWGGDDYGVT